MKRRLLIGGIVIALGAFGYLTIPWVIEEECLEKCVAGIMISESINPRMDIEKRILLTGSVEGSGNGISTDAINRKYVDMARIESGGQVMLKNTKFGISIALKPQLRNNEVKWTCNGTPSELLPTSCRQE